MLEPYRLTRQMRHQDERHVADRGVEVIEHRLLLGDPFGVPVERRMFGQVPTWERSGCVIVAVG